MNTSSEKNFSFEPAPAMESGCAQSCPLARVPEKVWRYWLLPPFRKRHPWIFYSGVVLLLGLVAAFILSDKEDFGEDRLALVEISGPILSISEQLEWIRKLSVSPQVKGVLLRIDSPGGGAAASQELYEELRLLGKRKPIAVSMGSTAASGGVMVAMAGRRIFANASTVTGSIGVRMDLPQIGPLLDKLGVGQETLTTAPFKDAGSILRPLTPEQRAYFEHVLNDMHEQFKGIIAQGRKMPMEKVTALANGKIFTGREALSLGLVDELGGQSAALRWLAEQTKVPASRKLLKKPEENPWLSRSLKTWLGIDLSALAPALQQHSSPAFLYQL